MFALKEKSSGYLFSSVELRDTVAARIKSMQTELGNIEPNRFLNTSSEDLGRYLIEKYSIDVPTLRQDERFMTEKEAAVDVRGDPRRIFIDQSRPALVPGQHIEIEVPVEGDIQLLYSRASAFTSMPPRAVVRGQSLILEFDIPHDSPRDNLKEEIENRLKEVEQYLSFIKTDAIEANRRLADEVTQGIRSRRERILANQGRVASLGIPLKSRDGPSPTYVIPHIRKKLAPVLPPSTGAAYEPVPVIDMAHYEHILTVIQRLGVVMERSPSAFRTLGEEHLRHHILASLNDNFEGATAETFNFNGKTDILLRENGRNAFIGECKFWKGPKKYAETIDQLLGYKSWRDTKTAIIVFNRGTGLSKVLEGIDKESLAHKNFKRKMDWKHETGFRYVFHHIDDPNREFILTVLVFDVPGPIEESHS